MNDKHKTRTHLHVSIFFLFTLFTLNSQAQLTVAGRDTSEESSNRSSENHPYDRSLHPLLRQIRVYTGVCVPLGDFGSPDPSFSSSGFAATAVSGGIEYNAEVIRGLGITFGETFSLHNTKKDGWVEKYPNYNFEINNWLLLWSTAGIFIDQDFSVSTNFYVDGQAGILYSNYPQISIIDSYNQSGIITAPAVTAFGYKVGGGIRWNRFELGLHYFSSDIDFQSYADFHSLSSNPKVTIEHFPQQVPIRVLLASFAFLFDR
ncbi:MAG: hypothetical protein ACHQQQ_14355 [Bacteroidota bacterium]